MGKFFGCTLIILIISVGDVWAQQPTRINEEINLDGVLDESFWQSITSYPVVQYEPVYKGEMSEKTVFKIAYDDNYLYVGGALYYNDIDDMTSNSLVRDKYSQDDIFAIVIDGFNDNQNATWFFTNPDGTRFDFAVSNDASSGGGRSSRNASWNTFWDVATTKTNEGWFAEMKIPFSSIGIQVEDNISEMGIIMYRLIASKNERHVFPDIPPKWGMGFAKPSIAQDFKLEGLEAKNPLYVTPYVLGGVKRLSEYDATNNEYNYDDDTQLELGFDAKYNLTPNLTLDVTVNTDFAQVEADDQQLNLSRFSLFFPEKRQFFQQRAGIYDFLIGRDMVFYSRRIGLDSSGNPVRILGGGRVTGRVGNLDIGVMNLQTADSENLPSENFGVVRLKKTVLNDRSYLGGIFTSRLGANGNSNVVYGVDTDINTFDNQFVELRAVQSIDSDLPSAERTNFDETSMLRVSVRSLTETGFSYQTSYTRTAENFRPELGFVRIKGITQKYLTLGYGWLAKEESMFTINKLKAFYVGRFYNTDHEFFSYEKGLQSRSANFIWESKFKKIGELGMELVLTKEDIPIGESFDLLGKIFIPSDTYSNHKYKILYRLSETWKFGGNIRGGIGTFYDGDIIEFEFNPYFYASRKVEIGGSYKLTDLRFPERAGRTTTDFTSHLGQFKGQFSFDKKASISAFIQYSNVEELVGANIRFRYNFREGQDLWIVLNETSYTNRDPRAFGMPDLPMMQSGSILLKYNHTFGF